MFKKLVDECNKTKDRSTDKKPIHAEYFSLLEEFESIHKPPKFKIGDRVKVTNYKKIH